MEFQCLIEQVTMRLSRFESLFPETIVPQPQIAAYESLAHRIIDRTIAQYERSRYRSISGSAKIDENRWKLVKERNDSKVFKQRACARTAPFNCLESLFGFDPIIAKTYSPELIGVGSVEGTLNDALYGAVIESTRDLRMRVAYTGGDLEDAQVLQAFSSPSPLKPFEFSGVVWLIQSMKAIPFMKKRDFIQLHFVGTRSLANGEQIGYMLNHCIETVSAPQLYESMSLVRGKSSICVLWRQATDRTLEIYQRGFFAPLGDAPEFVAITCGAESIFSAQNIVHASYAKKFFRYIGQMPHYKSAGAVSTQNERSTECSGGCTWNATRKNGVCIVCRKLVCPQCKFVKRIVFDIQPDGGVIEKHLLGCIPCITNIRRTDAYPLALQDSRKRDVNSISSSTTTEICG